MKTHFARNPYRNKRKQLQVALSYWLQKPVCSGIPLLCEPLQEHYNFSITSYRKGTKKLGGKKNSNIERMQIMLENSILPKNKILIIQKKFVQTKSEVYCHPYWD